MRQPAYVGVYNGGGLALIVGPLPRTFALKELLPPLRAAFDPQNPTPSPYAIGVLP